MPMCQHEYLFWFTGIFDTRQRHQIKNGHKIGKHSLTIQLTPLQCENLINVYVIIHFHHLLKYSIV